MSNKEWLRQLSALTVLPYYEQHKIFGDKSGALIGTRDGYIVAVGLGRADGNYAAVKMLLRFSKAPDPQRIKRALEPVKGKFKVITDESTAALIRTYSFGKPNAAGIAEDLQNLLAALKTVASQISGKCEECGRAEQQILLLNNVPGYYCSGCQVQLRQKLDAAAVAYENLETNFFLGVLYGVVAAALGSIAWGGVAYLAHRIFLWGAIIIGLFVGKAVVKGIGKVTWQARILIGVLTTVSVLFGDAIFYALSIAAREQTAFSVALKAVLTNFWIIERKSDSGVISILFALVGAGIVMYNTRKPAFKAIFVPLGTPASTLSSSAAAK